MMISKNIENDTLSNQPKEQSNFAVCGSRRAVNHFWMKKVMSTPQPKKEDRTNVIEFKTVSNFSMLNSRRGKAFSV